MLRRCTAVCACLALLTLSGCNYVFPEDKPETGYAGEEVSDSSEKLARTTLIGFINSVDNRDIDNFFRFSDMGFLCEVSGTDAEETKAGMEKEEWYLLYDTGLVENVKAGVYVTGIQDMLADLKGSSVYPDIDISRITEAYRYSVGDNTNDTYVLKIDGEWRTDLALVNVAERIRNEKE